MPFLCVQGGKGETLWYNLLKGYYMRYVLHADDDQEDRWNLKYLINGIDPNVEVCSFTNGLELIYRIESMEANTLLDSVIFLDVRMPIWDGIRTLKTLKANPSFNYVPVYMWSVAESRSEMGLYIKHGARDFLIKPTEPDDWETTKSKLKEILKSDTLK